jgi:DNA-binding NtrC family response regulator
MSPATQSKVLRLLQEQSFERLGGNEAIQVNVRVLCATNRNLEEAIAEGKFREDLYHRLNGVTIQIPPLRERRDDIPSLIEYFLSRAARVSGHEKPPLTEEVLASLVNYQWPGNVRELEHVIQQLVILTGGYTVQEADLPQSLRTGVQGEAPGGRARVAAPGAGPGAEDSWPNLVREYLASYRGDRAHEELLEKIERLLIAEALDRSKGNQTRAADLLGLTRPTLHAKIQKYGLRGWGDAPPL